MKKGLIFAIVWGFIIGIILTVGFDLEINQSAWWIWMIVLNVFGNFVIAPVLIKEEEDL